MSDRLADQTTFVLLHGAWHGAWCWRDVKGLLEQAGHRVVTPTFTGLGDRAHLLRPDVGLDTHIEDVLAALRYEEVKECVLVAHSYAGIVLEGVLSRLAHGGATDQVLLRHLVYLDAVIVPDGQRWCDAQTSEQVAARVALATDNAQGVSVIAPPAPEQLGIGIANAQHRVRSLMTPHPFRTYFDRLHAPGTGVQDVGRTYVDCVLPALPALQISKQRACSAGWPMETLQAGHDCMISSPESTTQVLLSCGGLQL